MNKSWAGCFLCVVLSAGCTSFRTSALLRLDNDSVVREKTNRKLKGLPVKLKVPSHVKVDICEQQLILANSTAENDERKKVAAMAAAAVVEKDTQIRQIKAAKIAAETAKTAAEAQVTDYTTKVNTTTGAEHAKYQQLLKLATERRDKADQALLAATNAEKDLPALETKLEELKVDRDLKARDAAVGYTLVSFEPAQLVVTTKLLYTDKIFLVDFKRPAGGILDLTEASMDDEHYFADVQAKIQEQTISDISEALKTVGDAVSPLKKSTVATPTAANTPDGEGAETVDFQLSVVATQRFDISEPDWETRMTAFVNERIGAQGQCRLDPIPALPTELTPTPGFAY